MTFWAAATISYGHLLFSLATTGYILVAIWLEERDLVALFGDRYRADCDEVGMLIPGIGRRRSIPKGALREDPASPKLPLPVNLAIRRALKA